MLFYFRHVLVGLVFLIALSWKNGVSAVETYYDVLGVSKTATKDEIRKAYKKLALIWHPDKKQGVTEKFQKIQKAYETLWNTELRSRYDAVEMPGPFMRNQEPQFTFHTVVLTLADLYRAKDYTVSYDLPDSGEEEIFITPDFLTLKDKRNIVREDTVVVFHVVQGNDAEKFREFTLNPESKIKGDVLYRYNSKSRFNQRTLQNIVLPKELTGKSKDDILKMSDAIPIDCNSVQRGRKCFKFTGYGIPVYQIYPVPSWKYGDLIVEVF